LYLRGERRDVAPPDEKAVQVIMLPADDRFCVLASHVRPTFQKHLKAVATIKIVDQCLYGNASAFESDGAANDFWLSGKNGL
jgi:hypothetical protein